MKNLINFINKHNYQTNIIYISSIFFNIPFFEEKLTSDTKLELKSIYDYVRDDKNEPIELLEIGKYFYCKTTFDYEKSNRTSYEIKPFNLDKKILAFISNNVDFSLSDINTINKLNKGLDPDTYTEVSDLNDAMLINIFEGINHNISVGDYYRELKQYFEETEKKGTLIVNQISFLYLFQVENIIKLKEKTIANPNRQNENSFSIELLPSELTFNNEIAFNFWTDNSETTIIVKNNKVNGKLRIDTVEKNKKPISLSELNLNKALFKADSLNNLSCKITNLKNNSITSAKINFN